MHPMPLKKVEVAARLIAAADAAEDADAAKDTDAFPSPSVFCKYSHTKCNNES
jgi:hypothetical protein